jgi:hypothetical protein
MARYFKERGRRYNSLAVAWGECWRYVEIAEDRFAARQVEDYGKGRVLRYDRSHWCDEFGQLFGCLFSHKQKAISSRRLAEVIEASEFERAWKAAQRSPLWEEQVASSLAAERGAVPFWLRTRRA